MDIRKYELSEQVIASPITKGSFYSKSISISKPGHNVAIIDKKQLHKELLDKCIDSGVHLYSGCRVDDILLRDQYNIQHIQDIHGTHYTGEIYIDATGTAGLMSKKSGLQETTFPLAVGLEYNASYAGDPHEVIFFIGPEYAGGYGWIFPLGNQRAIVGFGTFNPRIRSNLKQGLAAVVADRRVKHQIQIDDLTTYGGNIPITQVNRTIQIGNLVCVGDSVSQVNPLVGEGYKFILDASILAVEAINQALTQKNMALLKQYENQWNNINYIHYKNAKLLQNILACIHQHNWSTDIGLLFLKFKRTDTVARIVSGQFDKRDLWLP